MTQPEVSGAAIGWTIYASVMMGLLGGFHAIAGFIALLEDEFYLVTPNYVFQFDVTTWGWIHLIMGIVVVAAAVALYSGAVWARTVGVIIAIASTLLNFAWLPWYPFWSIIMIAANALVIWALTVHGRDIAEGA